MGEGGEYAHVVEGFVLQVLQLELPVDVDDTHEVGVQVEGHLGCPVADDLLAVQRDAGQTLLHNAALGTADDESVVLGSQRRDVVLTSCQWSLLLTVLVGAEVSSLKRVEDNLFPHLTVNQTVTSGWSETPIVDFLL